MLPDRVSNPGPLTYESGALPIACSGGLSLPRKSVVRLTDHPDMTIDVYRGRKTTTHPSIILLLKTFHTLQMLRFNGPIQYLFQSNEDSEALFVIKWNTAFISTGPPHNGRIQRFFFFSAVRVCVWHYLSFFMDLKH